MPAEPVAAAVGRLKTTSAPMRFVETDGGGGVTVGGGVKIS
jgi:hypothetical protein